MKTLSMIFSDASIRNRIFFVIGILVLTRALASIPVPGIDTSNLAQFLDNNSLFGLLNIFSGGGLSTLSIAMLGVGPYITASIIMQLMTVLVPRFKEMYQEEGERGRQRFVQYGRLLALPFAFLQGIALLALLVRQNVIPQMDSATYTVNLVIIVAASMLLMWMGEKINERGIGNGVSLIIFSGIVAALPQSIGQFLFAFDISQLPVVVTLLAVALITIAGVVFVTEAERPIEVAYAKQGKLGASATYGTSTYLPLRLNQAGVVPIIFAISILLFPQLLAQLLGFVNSPSLQSFAQSLSSALQNPYLYGSLYFALVVIFTYFYTAIIFDPEKTADNLQKNSAFVPGHRPGAATAEYIGSVLGRITLVGAVFLGCVAVLPYIVQQVTGITAIAIGGTSLLIAVSVLLDVTKKVSAQVTMREY